MEELIPIFLFVVLGGVLIMRPVTKKLGVLIEALARERLSQPAVAREGVDAIHLERMTLALERLDARLDHLEDRLGFMERLVEERPRSRLTS